MSYLFNGPAVEFADFTIINFGFKIFRQTNIVDKLYPRKDSSLVFKYETEKKIKQKHKKAKVNGSVRCAAQTTDDCKTANIS